MYFNNYNILLKSILICCNFKNILSQQFEVTHQVFFEIAIAREHVGRIEIGLFGNITPKTVENFYTLATKGIDGKSYNGSIFHRIIKKFMIQGGDIVHENGLGSISIYGDYFEDENFDVNHIGPGYLSMANTGPNLNGCQFFITTVPTPWLDNKHVVFGKVTKGQNIVHKIERVKTNNYDYPLQTVQIIDSGAIPTPKSFYINAVFTYSLWDWMRDGAVPLSFSFAILTFFYWALCKLDKAKFKDD